MLEFKSKVVYQIYPKSFKDSNGDGIGDLRGIIEKLDYLEFLGVDYLWLTPFFVSPQNDNGYDVADYRRIDPLFGTMEDLEELIAKADKKGIGLMLDMVFNHTSTQHEWFQKALRGDPEYMDYYIFKDGRPEQLPTNWESKFGGPAWEYVPYLKKWYLHLFDATQADLNWENPRVREELKSILRFWKKKGIKGFRFDVVNLISKPEVYKDDFEGDGRRFYTDGRHVHDFLKELVRDAEIEDMMTVGEMSSTSLENCIRYSNPDEKELTMCFNFHHLKIDYRDGNKWELMEPDISALKELFNIWQVGMQQAKGWNAVFWCNHDQPRIISRLGDDRKYWRESAKMLAASIHMMRGTPYIYQGEELGMTNAGYESIDRYRDVESLNYYDIMLKQGKTKKDALEILAARSRDNARTPMQWSDKDNAGFTEVEPWISLPDNYKTINAEAEAKDESSILSFYKKVICLRKEKAVIAEGNIEFLDKRNPDVLAYRRMLGAEEIIVLCNLRGKEAVFNGNVELTTYEKILGNYAKEGERLGKLRPYETVIYEKMRIIP
ncbi:alpha,alpha-phosphotrehalase [Faecalicatena contorta]|uniref:Alpha,alpha-phosphotrehalase n=1 Tax=Faecalicatena contorta TaxID=39482 RepID=A0A316A093_9FIRM|nr:alpha,alpha-phosphotrehalase [Faecalicatena contorta]PWJ51003.1 trehalose-6-phosphate hydrolase [Faecalicatena contorta]SUQ13571.1 trehalose-6-phosphate hydrolase [Faecalicatena contorta]